MMPTRSEKVPAGPVVMRILVRCPRTAKLYFTGLTTKANRFAQIEVADNKLSCAHCGKVHLWAEDNVVFARLATKREE